MADRRGSARTRTAAPLAVVVLALAITGCSSTPSAAPSAGPTMLPTIDATATALPSATAVEPSQPATAEPSAISAAPACTGADLKASHDLVEGAAGSVLTTVVLVAAAPCSVDLFPAMGLRDANGSDLLASTPTGAGRLDLDPDLSYSSAVRLGNWCNPEPSFPLSLVIRIGAEQVAVTGSSFPEQGELPPCNGGGGPVFETGQWEAVAP